jgi:hypothetical protein
MRASPRFSHSLLQEVASAVTGASPEEVRRANMLLGDIGQTAVLAREAMRG